MWMDKKGVNRPIKRPTGFLAPNNTLASTLDD
jgi:hypothetical protein